ncbi:MAG TPA: tetratricopeptide repeat protein [Verrucomicrobiae bacterium]|nr:tetratricopeptide repeat protein [Verrucomicrobiae bacterium]
MAQEAQNNLRITDQFDFETFWAENSKKIIIGVLAVVVFGGGVLFWQYRSNQQMELAADSLAKATDPSSLEQVAREFQGTDAALEALSRLSEMQYREGRYAEAASTYERILKEFPSNPLSESARLGLAAVQEAQGNFEAAKGLYSQIVESGPTSFIASAAKMGMARCLEASGQLKEARQLYEEILAAGPGSPWRTEAYLRWVVLKRELPATASPGKEAAQQPPISNWPSYPSTNAPVAPKQP